MGDPSEKTAVDQLRCQSELAPPARTSTRHGALVKKAHNRKEKKMTTSFHTKQITRLALALAILLNCFARPIYSASLSTPRAGGRSVGNLTGLSPALTTLSSLTQTTEADMAVYTSALPTAVAPGGTVNRDSTMSNDGPDQATSATRTTTLPPDVEVNTATTPDGSCTVTPITGGTSVSCPRGDMGREGVGEG